MKHNTGKTEWQFNEKMVNSVCVFKLEVEELACKEHEQNSELWKFIKNKLYIKEVIS